MIPEAPKQARSTRLLVILQFSIAKTAWSTRLFAFFLFSDLLCSDLPESQIKTGPEHDTVIILPFQVPKTSPEHETVCIFTTSKAKNGPEHETVRVFAILALQKGPLSRTGKFWV